MLVSDQRAFAAREVAKEDARLGGYVSVGGHAVPWAVAQTDTRGADGEIARRRSGLVLYPIAQQQAIIAPFPRVIVPAVGGVGPLKNSCCPLGIGDRSGSASIPT